MNRPDPHHVDILTLPACRRLLGKAAEGVSDDELERLRDQLYGVALCAVGMFEASTTSDTVETTALDCLPTDARQQVEERAAIVQFDGHLPKGLADCAAASEYSTGGKRGR